MDEIIKKIDECNFSMDELNAIIVACSNNKKKNQVELIKNKLLFEKEIKDIDTINLIKKIIDFEFEFENKTNYSENSKFIFKIILDNDENIYTFEFYYNKFCGETYAYYSIHKYLLNSLNKQIEIFYSDLEDLKDCKDYENIILDPEYCRTNRDIDLLNKLSHDIGILEPIKLIKSMYYLFDIMQDKQIHNML